MNIKNTILSLFLLVCFGGIAQETVKDGTIKVVKKDVVDTVSQNRIVVRKSDYTTVNVVAVPDKVAKYYGGIGEMNNFISRNIVYPQKALEEQITGTVYITFVVDEEGKTSDFRCLKGIASCPECDAEALRVVKLLKGWVPGEFNGGPARTQFNLPVKFIIK